MHCDELLLTTTCQSSSTGRPIFLLQITMKDCDWPIKSQIQTTSLVSLQCRNSKSNHLRCKYLSFHTFYGLETLGIHLHSSPLLARKVLGKSEIWLKVLLEGR